MRNAFKVYPKFNIRAAARCDLNGVMKVENNSFSGGISYTKGLFEKYLRRSLLPADGVSMLVASAGSAGVIGYALGERLNEDRRVAEISSIAVHGFYRGKGLGAQLLERISTSLRRQHNIASVVLHVDETNHVAIGMYRKYGFVDRGAVPDYYAPGRDALSMSLRLGG